nr:alpha/beta fold hydrolase [Promicromonospora iranensis]
MFTGFTTERVRTGEASIFVRHGGSGEPVLLLHGHPRTSATWHRVAPRLVDAGFFVVCPDLRGYGRSRGPEAVPDHSAHSKRAVARDMLTVMRQLVFSTISTVHESVYCRDRGEDQRSDHCADP